MLGEKKIKLKQLQIKKYNKKKASHRILLCSPVIQPSLFYQYFPIIELQVT